MTNVTTGSLPLPVEQRRIVIAQRFLLIQSVFAAILSGIFVLWAMVSPQQPLFLLSGTLAFVAITGIILRYQFPNLNLNIQLLIASTLLLLSLILISASFVDILIPVAVFCFLYAFLLAAGLMTGVFSDTELIIGLLSAVGAILAGLYSPLDQILSLGVRLGVIAFIVFQLVTILIFFITRMIVFTIRVRLITVFLLVGLVPLISLSYIQTTFLENALMNQARTSLNTAARQAALGVDKFIQDNLSLIARQAALPIFADYLYLPSNSRSGSNEEAELISTIKTLEIPSGTYAPSFSLANLFGIKFYDTNPQEIGKQINKEDYFQQPLLTNRPYFSPVIFDSKTGAGSIYFSAPIKDINQKNAGVLMVRFNALILQNLLQGYSEIVGKRSYPVLIDENTIRLADAITPGLLYKSIMPLSDEKMTDLKSRNLLPQLSADQLSSNLPNFASAVSNPESQGFFSAEVHPGDPNHVEMGSSVNLESKPWQIIYLEDTTNLNSLRTQQNQLSILFAALFAALVGLIGVIVSRFLSNPIVQLTGTASRIADGDLSAKAVVRSRDELGTLADTFNSMTSQLKTLISELEERVRARTQELASRNEALVLRGRQLTTVADVAREITRAQDLESLLDTLVRLVSERFNFYHVGIFLLDEDQEYAVLRASNSEGGRRMLNRGHKLKVGEVGIVGYVTGSGKPRIATDVGIDAVYFQNPDLPLTRSEMTLPLIIGDRIIGAFDVQSTEANIFSQEDVELFTILADQVAIAIENNLLLQETVRALESSQSLHRQYLLQEWGREIDERDLAGFEYTPSGVKAIDREDSLSYQKVLESGEPVFIPMIDQPSGKPSVSLAVPIILRGETIGVINIEESRKEKKDWQPEEIQAVQSVASQVALALENARLFEQTVRRAERDRKVLEITGKIRSTTNPQEMVQIAIEELQHVLKASRAQILIQDTNPPEGTNPTSVTSEPKINS
jgi:GAF domain-containing protein/HAMP domain-containing protein